jgi:hypothetical protein
MRKTGKRFNKNNEDKTAAAEAEEEAMPERPKMLTPFFKRESKVGESTAKPEPPRKETSTAKETMPQKVPERTNLNLSELIP